MANIRWGASRLGLDTTLGYPSIATLALPNATVGSAYFFTMTAVGGVPPYTWSITSDTPDTGSWLSIAASTGVLSGTPTTAETESVTIKVTDNVGHTASQSYTLGVMSSGLYVGLNLNNFGAGSNTPSTLNIFKGGQSYTNYGSTYPNYTFWYTSNGSTQDTNEELYLLPYLDSDGYPTTLTIPGIPGGQKFTYVQTLLNWSFTTPPGASYPYPADTYTLRWQGKGTITLGNDAGAFTSASAGCTISGNTVTSTNAWGTTNTATFPVSSPSGGGITYAITALPTPTTAYIKAVEVVQNTYLANFLAGEIWHPIYKSILSSLGVQRIRSMVLTQTNNQEIAVNFTSGLSGATSATISNVIWNKQTSSTWPLPTGTYNFLFPNNGVVQKATVNCVNGSASVTGFSTAITCPSSASSAWGQAYTGYLQSWANRATLSTCFWNLPSRGGTPWEAIIQLCIELGIDLWGNAPGFASAYDSSYYSSLANLLYNGTGANLTGSYLTSFTGLPSSKKYYAEWGNEPWNFGEFPCGDFCISMSYGINGQTNQYACSDEYVGIQTGAMGAAFYSIYGASFASRVVVRASGQNDTSGYHANYVMNAPDYVALGATAPYLQGHISGLIIPLYVGDYGFTSTDATYITSLPNPVNEWFSIAFSHIGASGHTYDTTQGFPANGWIGGYYATGATWSSNISSQPWKTATLSSYEFGTSLDGDFSSAYVTMMTNVHRDARMSYVFYDPTNQLWPVASGQGFCPAVLANGISDFNVFQDIYQLGVYPAYYGEWGCLESMFQTFSPISSAPAKFQGVALYIES